MGACVCVCGRGGGRRRKKGFVFILICGCMCVLQQYAKFHTFVRLHETLWNIVTNYYVIAFNIMSPCAVLMIARE